MKICVVGAGPAGLCAIRQGISFGCDVTAFEQANQIGGTWIYTDDVGKDKYGNEIHSSMYQGLFTNLPKEIMASPDFLFPFEDRSYISSDKILKYLNLYADNFNLREKIKFEHHVLRVRPLLDDTWEVIVKNLTRSKYETFIFDSVLVCNGFSTPLIPKFDGQSMFKGKQIHSHDYRNAEQFKDEKVLIIGAGPSGIEMVLSIGKVAKSVLWSNHTRKSFKRDLIIELPKAVIHKPDVIKFTETSVEFEDGTIEEISVVAYATGYDFCYPFLSIDCGLSCYTKCIQPLYKHCININRPSMAIIGLPFFAIAMPMFDLQVRFFLKFLCGGKKLPLKEDMLQDTERDQDVRSARGFPKKAHFLGPIAHASYYEALAKTGEIAPLKPVLAKIFNKSVQNLFTNFNNFKNYNFKIVDDENFVESYDETDVNF